MRVIVWRWLDRRFCQRCYKINGYYESEKHDPVCVYEGMVLCAPCVRASQREWLYAHRTDEEALLSMVGYNNWFVPLDDLFKHFLQGGSIESIPQSTLYPEEITRGI